jgi:hypothetical protein
MQRGEVPGMRIRKLLTRAPGPDARLLALLVIVLIAYATPGGIWTGPPDPRTRPPARIPAAAHRPEPPPGK